MLLLKLLRRRFPFLPGRSSRPLLFSLLLISGVFLFFVSVPFESRAADPILINARGQMACGERQVLSIMNYRSGRTYTWTLAEGGGILEGGEGEKVGYAAPESNPNCENNPVIRVTDSGGSAGEIRIAVNGYTGPERACWTDDDYYVSPYTGQPFSKRLHYYRKSYTCRGSLLISYTDACVCSDPWCEETVPPHLDFRCSNPNPAGYTICGASYCQEIDANCDLWGSWQHGCIGDGRTETMKNAGCCPEALLPGYALKVPLPDDLELGKDPSLNVPVCDPSLKGNPIRISDGNNIETVEDVSLKSPFHGGLTLKRYYSSRSKTSGPLGYGWSHTFSAAATPGYVWKRETYLRIVDETGRGVYFREEGGGQYRGAFKEKSRVRVEEGNFVWMRLDGSRYVFGEDGRVLWIEDRIGNRQVLSHDEEGRITRVQDEASNRWLSFEYDVEGRITRVAGPVTGAVADGVWVTYGYDGKGNLVSATFGDGSGFRYAYGDAKDVHNLTEKRDAEGHILSTWTYDDQDRAVGNFTRDGRGVTIEYVSENETRVTDAYGVTRTYRMWDTAGGRKRITDIEAPQGCSACGEEIVRLEYDEDLNVIEVAYASGRIDQYEDFDERGNAATVIQAVGTEGERVIHYTYHPELDALLSRREVSVLGQGEKLTVWDHDDDGDDEPNEAPVRVARRLIEKGYTRDIAGIILPFQYTTRFEFDGKGHITELDGPMPGSEDLVAFSYDPVTGDLGTITLPLVGMARLERYDGAGQAGRMIDPNGNAVLYSYDGRGRVTNVVHETDGAETTYAYHPSGEISALRDPDGVRLTFIYDALYGRLERVEDALGNSIRYAYDDQGNRREVSYYAVDGPRTYVRRYDFHGPQSPGRLWKEIEPDGVFTEYAYDVMGNLASVTDPLGRSTHYEYDDFRRLKRAQEPEGVITGYAYDRHGNLKSVTDPEGHVTNYVFDDLGRVMETDSPDTGKTVYAYDESGNLKAKRDADGTTVTYSYDALNRLTAVHYPGGAGDVSYRYDEGPNGRGRRAAMADASGETTYEYDAKGNLIKETQALGEAIRSTAYTFSPGGRLADIAYPSGLEVLYALDPLGEVSAVRVRFMGQEYVLAEEIRRQSFGPMVGMRLGNRTEASRGYDESYRVSSIHEGAVLELSFGYDGAGNISGIENRLDPSRSLSFSYDALDRLTRATGIYGTIGYTYDRTGNRLSRTRGGETDTYSYVAGTNRVLEVEGDWGEKSFGYDADGNTVAIGDLTLVYGEENRLTEVAVAGEVLARYQYNGKGERVGKTAGGREIFFDYDPRGKLVGVRGECEGRIRHFVYLDGRLLALVEVPEGELDGKDTDSDGDSDGRDLAELALQCGNGTPPDVEGFAGVFGKTDLQALRIFWFHSDHLGTPQKMTAKDQAVVWQADYRPFGETEILTKTVENPIRFPGQYYDSETGFHYNYFRYYDPSIGRYLRPDPIGMLGGENLFGYSEGDPIGSDDPLALWPTRIHNKIIRLAFPLLDPDLRRSMERGSAFVDEHQDPKFSYMHAMRAKGQSVEQARKLMTAFISDKIKRYKRQIRKGNLTDAFFALGEALHPLMDSTAPPHEGFQWWDHLLSMPGYYSIQYHWLSEQYCLDAEIQRTVELMYDVLQKHGINPNLVQRGVVQ